MVRQDWLTLMLKIADPVLHDLAARRLHETLPVEKQDRSMYAHLEAFGRTMTGISPWLALEGLTGEEAELQKRYRALAAACMDAATDPESPDHMNFSEGYGQSLVDTAFLAHAILRAPDALYRTLDKRVRHNIAEALRAARRFEPFPSNWLFFSAMIEAALLIMGEAYDPAPVDRAIDAFEKWYVGDGAYGDGERFHFDYYNSFVIHPMYVDVLEAFSGCGARYAALLPAQVRCALSAVLARTSAGGMFDEKGFLRTGVSGSQPSLGEGYICTGSLYLCQTVFLPLGLAPQHPFWSAPEEAWTSKKIWSGLDLPFDCAVD